MPGRVADYAELTTLDGTDLGATEYREVTQEQINLFADATGDHQWIHVDPIKAGNGPFGATVAHGFLTLSLLIPLWGELFDVAGVTTKINYGLDRVRFPSSVTVGSRVRLRSSIDSVTEVAAGMQIRTDNTIDIENQGRPAVVAAFLARFYQ